MSRSGRKICCNQNVELDNALVENICNRWVSVGYILKDVLVLVGVGVVMVQDTPTICRHLRNFTGGEEGEKSR